MHRSTVGRFLLACMLIASVGLATQATAFAENPATRRHSVVARKKRKVIVKVSPDGPFLTDGKGRTLYHFDLDTGIDESACDSTCSTVWLALKAKKPKAGAGVDASLLEVGASGQVAFSGHLLYRYAGDSAPGDTNGDGIGGVWHTVNPAGI